MNYTIRKSIASDIPTLLRLADDARKTMRRSGNMNQWVNGYPDEQAFERDIEGGHSYVVLDDTLQPIATFAFIPGPDITYRRIKQGRWLDETRAYAVIHRVAALPSRHGVMKDILRYCFSIIDNIRIDTHRDNTIMRHCLASCGFSYCGIIHLLNGDERLAYQKIIR